MQLFTTKLNYNFKDKNTVSVWLNSVFEDLSKDSKEIEVLVSNNETETEMKNLKKEIKTEEHKTL